MQRLVTSIATLCAPVPNLTPSPHPEIMIGVRLEQNPRSPRISESHMQSIRAGPLAGSRLSHCGFFYESGRALDALAAARATLCHIPFRVNKAWNAFHLDMIVARQYFF